MIRILIVILLFPLLSTSQPNQVDTQGNKQGAWIGEYDDGEIKFKGQFENNIPVGSFTFYYPSGEVMSKIEYQNEGQADVVFLHKDGIKKAAGKYLNQKKEGNWNFYDTEGKIAAIDTYVKGQKNGLSKVYYDNGKVSETVNWNLGKREGLTTEYFKDGKKKSESNYVDDELQGRSMVFFPNGQFKTVGKYVDGVKNGTWMYYNQDGKEHFRESYDQGKRISSIPMNGTFKTYYEGDIEIMKNEITYKNGKKDGPFKEFYKKGEWKYERRVYDQEKEPGRAPDMIRTFEGEVLKRKGTYQNDLLDGEIHHYDESGKLISTDIYMSGEKTN